MAAAVAAVVGHAGRAATLTTALADGLSREFLQRGLEGGWPLRPLGEVAEVNPRPARLDPEASVAFVPMAAVDASSGTIRDSTTRLVDEIGAGYKQFRQGDVIFARITPCMQNGKSAIFRHGHQYGYGSTEFHVLRPGRAVMADWLHAILRTRDFRDAAAERFTGTAGQQRVPAKFLMSNPIPVPPLEEQRGLVALLAQQRTQVGLMERSQERVRALADALVPAALNEAFAGLS
ncbi:MAG: hypothetical protein WEB19_03360 [Acidimicrobiia bacterium]